MAFSNPIDTSTPIQTEALTQGDNRIRETKLGIQELLDVDHEASLTGTSINSIDSGCHNKTTFLEQVVDASPPSGLSSNYGILYTKLDSDTSQSELFWIDENDNILQITKGNTVDLDLNFLSNNIGIEGNLVGEASAVPMIKVDTSDQVVVYHTTAKPARLTSNDPPLADADIANMKYVDDQISGNLAQIVNTTTGAVATGSTIIPADDTIPQKTEGDQYMTLSITPRNSSNILIIEVTANVYVDSGADIIIALFQDDTSNALSAAWGRAFGAEKSPLMLRHYMIAGTTSATTFKIRIGTEVSRTVTFNGVGGSRKFGGVLDSSITITEYVV